jgi:small subunit ribosomal protein S8
MYTDPIADYLTRIRNAVRANHRVVEIPASNLKKDITKILFEQGYILSYKFDDSTVQGTIKIALKYNKETKEPVIKKIQRISTQVQKSFLEFLMVLGLPLFLLLTE